MLARMNVGNILAFAAFVANDPDAGSFASEHCYLGSFARYLASEGRATSDIWTAMTKEFGMTMYQVDVLVYHWPVHIPDPTNVRGKVSRSHHSPAVRKWMVRRLETIAHTGIDPYRGQY